MSVQTNAEVHVTPSPALADAATEAAHASHQRKARPALRLVKTTEISRDDWLNVRRRGIGSSDAAAAVGLNPYQSRLALWMEKTGTRIPSCSVTTVSAEAAAGSHRVLWSAHSTWRRATDPGSANFRR